MRVVIEGHLYELFELDKENESPQYLRFVHRIGNNYPGNKEPKFHGTNLQDIYRCCINRHLYLDRQLPHNVNIRCIERLRENIIDLECRAAERHGRIPLINEIIETEPFCLKCGHIGCIGTCK